MDFTFVDPNTNSILRFPIPPAELQAEIGPRTFSFSPFNIGDVELPRGKQPVRLTLSGIFPGPGRAIPKVSPTPPNELVTRLKRWAENAYNRPLRFIVTETPWNLLVFISNFEPVHSGGHGDVSYTMTLTEWRQLVAQEVGMATLQATRASTATKRPDPRTQPRTYTVKAGDSLWKIAQKIYGNGTQWTKIFNANRDKIKDPDLIFPGQQLVIPA